MSMFICARCRGNSDADDGCFEVAGNRLICVDCMAESDDEPINIYGEEELEDAHQAR